MAELLLAERTGWTLDYIRTLNSVEFYVVTEMYSAIDAARSHIRKRNMENNGR